jgi:molecular chaperone GrpE
MSKKSNKENTSKIEDIESSKDLELEEKERTEENDINTPEEENKVLSELVKVLEEKVLRAQAEIENIRKISQKEILKSRIFSAESIAKDLLTPIDNLHRSLEHSEEWNSSKLDRTCFKRNFSSLIKQ